MANWEVKEHKVRNNSDVPKKTKGFENARYNDVNEKIKGGKYEDVKKNTDSRTHDVHHMPADSVSNLERKDGPAIAMEKEDHKKTASYGNSREAREYRQKQKERIDKGDFEGASKMDDKDIHDKFGNKYNKEINKKNEYINQLKKEKKI